MLNQELLRQIEEKRTIKEKFENEERKKYSEMLQKYDRDYLV